MAKVNEKPIIKACWRRLIRTLKDRKRYLDKESVLWEEKENEPRAARLRAASEECRRMIAMLEAELRTL